MRTRKAMFVKFGSLEVSLIAGVTAIIAIACASPRNAVVDSATVSDSAGTTIIVNHRMASEGQTLLLDSVPTVIIGADEADTTQHFLYPIAARLSDGRIVIGDRGNVWIFDSSGKNPKLIGARGAGPGEFESIQYITPFAGDTIIVHGYTKIVRFAPDGTLLSDERPSCGGEDRKLWEGPLYCRGAYVADGTAFAVQEDSTIPETQTNRRERLLANGMTSPGPGLYRRLYRLMVVPPEADTAFATGISAGIESFGIEYGQDRNYFVTHPFYSRSYHTAAGNPALIATATNPGYSISIWSNHGKLERIVRRSNGRRVPTAAEKEGVREMLAARRSAPISIERILAETPVPDSLPAISGLVLSSRGELVVQRQGRLVGARASLFDVFNSQGHWIAEWQLPRAARIAEMGDDYILAIRRDEDERPLIEIYRYRRASIGASVTTGAADPALPSPAR